MARDVFDRYGSPQDYGWFQKYMLDAELENTRQRMGSYGSSLKAGQQMGGTIGGLIGTYGGPALAGWLMGGPLGASATLAASAGGAAVGTGIGQSLGSIGTEAPDAKFLSGEIAKMYEDFNTANLTDIISSGVMTAGTGLSMGVDKYAKHVSDINKGAYTLARDPGNLEIDWGAMMPGGDPFLSVYEGEKMMIDPDWKQKMIYDKDAGGMIPDPSDTAAQHMIRDEDFYRNLPGGTSRKEADFAAREGDWWKYGIDTDEYGQGLLENQEWIPEQYIDPGRGPKQADPFNPGFDVQGNPLEQNPLWDPKYADYKAGDTVPFADYYEHLAKSGDLQPWLESGGGLSEAQWALPELSEDQLSGYLPSDWETLGDPAQEQWMKDFYGDVYEDIPGQMYAGNKQFDMSQSLYPGVDPGTTGYGYGYNPNTGGTNYGYYDFEGGRPVWDKDAGQFQFQEWEPWRPKGKMKKSFGGLLGWAGSKI